MNAKSKLIKRVLSVMMAAVLVFGAIPFAGMGLANLASAEEACTHPNLTVTEVAPGWPARYECADCGYSGWTAPEDTETADPAECEHEWEGPTQPFEDGALLYTCSKCGQLKWEAAPEAPVVPEECVEHTPGEHKSNRPATCTADGWDIYLCSVCSKKFSVAIPATGHTLGEPETIDATCEEDGKVIAKCTNVNHVPNADRQEGEPYWEDIACDYEEVLEVIPATGHAYEMPAASMRPATCTTEGWHIYVCKFCGHKVSETIEAKGHIGGDPVIVEPTCTTEGSITVTCTNVNHVPTGHTDPYWEDIACTEVLYTETIPMLPHNYTKEVDRYTATCSAAEVVIYECECGDKISKVEGNATGDHNWGEWCVDTVPSCEVNGRNVRTCMDCDAVDENLTPATGHTVTGNTWYTYKAATCTEDGVKAIQCDTCKKVIETEAIPATGHTAYEYTYKAPTCTEEGQMAALCTVCTENLGIVGTIPAKGHNYDGEWVVTVPSTCTVAGVETLYCVDCGEELDNRPAPLAPHEESNWIVILAPTCLTAGFQITVCVNCDLVMDFAILSAGHDAGAWETTIPATCAAPGEMVQSCKLCDAALDSAEIPALAHIPGEWEVVVAPSGADAGLMAQYCAICGACVNEKSVDAHTCIEGNPEILVAPTCEAEGVRITSCTICEKTMSETAVAALGHTEGAWKITVEPTLTTAGEKTQSCTVCAKVLDTAEVAAHECKAGKTEITKEATCAVAGIKATSCVICEAVMTEEAIPATGHDDGAYVTVKAPTCTEAGEKVLACTICAAPIKSEAIAALGHEAGAWVETKAATCSAAGEAVQKCTRCDATIDSKEIAAHEHVAGTTVIVKEATCTVDGIKATTCVNCKAVMAEEAIPATGHAAGAFVETKAATCNNAGEKTQYCTVCAQAIATEVIEPYGHSESGYVITIYADCVNYGEAITKCSTCAQVISTKVLEPIGHTAGPVNNCCEDQVCLTCGEVLVPADALSHVWTEWETFKAETIFNDRIERRFCVKCYAAGIINDEYREVAYTAKCHQCWPHNEQAEDCGCTACDVLNAIQGCLNKVGFALWFVLTQNIVTELLFPWFL